MKLIHPILSKPIIFEENKINVLVVENQKVFSELVIELLEQMKGLDGRFILSSNFKELELGKEADVLIDLFTLDFNQRKIITRIHNQLQTVAMGEEYYLESTSLLGKIAQYIEKITQTTQYPLAYLHEMDIATVFKLAEVKLETSYNSLAEKLLDYLIVMQEFCGISIFVFVNFKCYFSEEELDQVYQYIVYNKINVLLLENTMRENKNEREEFRIIDKDLCEIY